MGFVFFCTLRFHRMERGEVVECYVLGIQFFFRGGV